MKGFHAKPELIFFILILVVVMLLILGSGLLNGWIKGVVG